MARVINHNFVAQWILATTLAFSSAAINPLFSPLLLGVFQGIVLQKYIPQNGVWTLFTIVSSYLSLFVSTVLIFGIALVGRDSDTALDVLSLLLCASMVLATLVFRSSLQRRVLSQYCGKCRWWLITGPVGTVAGCSVAFSLQHAIYFSNPNFTSLRQGDLSTLLWIWALGGSVAGLIEAVALFKILSRRRT